MPDILFGDTIEYTGITEFLVKIFHKLRIRYVSSLIFTYKPIRIDVSPTGIVTFSVNLYEKDIFTGQRDSADPVGTLTGKLKVTGGSYNSSDKKSRKAFLQENVRPGIYELQQVAIKNSEYVRADTKVIEQGFFDLIDAATTYGQHVETVDSVPVQY